MLSRALSVMPSANIVHRLNRWALTGRALDIGVHHHYGYRMQFEWEGAFGERCFERRFPTLDYLSHFSDTWVSGTHNRQCLCTIDREGFVLCMGWVNGHVPDLIDRKTVYCRQRLFRTLAPLPEWGIRLRIEKCLRGVVLSRGDTSVISPQRRSYFISNNN